MVNVLMVLPRYLPIIGGAEVQCNRLIKKLKQDSEVNIVRVVTRRVSALLKQHEVIDDIPVTRLPPAGTGILAEYLFCLILLGWLLINCRKYDVIHCHATSIFGLTVSVAGAILGKKVIVKVSTNGEVAAMQNGKFKKRVVAFASRYCRYIALNNEGYDEVLKCIPNASVSLIPNGIEYENAADHQEAEKLRKFYKKKHGEKAFICVFVGRLVARKGIKDLIMVAADLAGSSSRKFCFIVVGDGELQRDAESLDATGPDGNIEMVGKQSNVFPYIMAADVFVSSSYNEGLPNAVLEALSCGKKCILSDIKPHMELMAEHPYHIDIFKLGDVNSLKMSLENASSTVIPSLKSASVLIDKYSINNVAKKYSDLYRDVA